MRTLGLWLHLEGEGEEGKYTGDSQFLESHLGGRLGCLHNQGIVWRSRSGGKGSSLT